MTNGEALEILNRDDKKMRRGLFCINDFIAIEKCKEVLASAPEWIPVSERLPQDGELVLVTTKRGSEKRVDFDLLHIYGDDDVSWEVNINQDVITWMPLPEPYKESENE